jgi:hypothetical protein
VDRSSPRLHQDGAPNIISRRQTASKMGFTGRLLGGYQTERVRVLHHDMSELNTAIKSHGDFAPFDGILGANVLDDCLAVIDYRTHDIYLMRRQVK